MDSKLLDRAFAALMSGADVKGWECIQPTRRYIPLAIQRKERELDEAVEALDMACDLHEQAGTEVTREALGEATRRVNDIVAELDKLREMWHEHPEVFDDDNVGVTP